MMMMMMMMMMNLWLVTPRNTTLVLQHTRSRQLRTGKALKDASFDTLYICSLHFHGNCFFLRGAGVAVAGKLGLYSVYNLAMVTTKIYIVFYSLHGHVEIMAREIQRGANAVQGVEATLWQVPETLSNSILNKVKANPKADDVPVILPEQLLEADGFLFGFPSRFGVMASQFKAFFDATHELWATQALAGKPAGFFWSTGFHGGGQELAAFTAITQLAHHGMLFVPLGYTFGSGMFEMGEVKGGSSYGSGTFAADGSRQPSELELRQAFYQGKYVSEITKKLKG